MGRVGLLGWPCSLGSRAGKRRAVGGAVISLSRRLRQQAADLSTWGTNNTERPAKFIASRLWRPSWFTPLDRVLGEFQLCSSPGKSVNLLDTGAETTILIEW